MEHNVNICKYTNTLRQQQQEFYFFGLIFHKDIMNCSSPWLFFGTKIQYLYSQANSMLLGGEEGIYGGGKGVNKTCSEITEFLMKAYFFQNNWWFHMLNFTRNTERIWLSVSVDDVLCQNWMFLWGNKADIWSH